MILFQLTSRPPPGSLSLSQATFEASVETIHNDSTTREEKLNRPLLLIPLPLCFRTARGIVSGCGCSRMRLPALFLLPINPPPFYNLWREGGDGDRKVLSREKEPGGGKMTPAIADHGYSTVQKER